MKISTYWLWEAPAQLKHPVVAIDAWAATTNLVLMLAKKPHRLILVNEKNFDKATSLYPDYFLIGESSKNPQIKFPIKNFPSDIDKAPLERKTILYMTINGTRVFEKFKSSQLTISCAFNNLKAVADYFKKFKEINIVLAGDYPNKVVEDEVCGQLLIDEIKGKKYNWQKVKRETLRIARPYYNWPEGKEKKSLEYIFSLSGYNIIPFGKINEDGFVEIKNLLS